MNKANGNGLPGDEGGHHDWLLPRLYGLRRENLMVRSSLGSWSKAHQNQWCLWIGPLVSNSRGFQKNKVDLQISLRSLGVWGWESKEEIMMGGDSRPLYFLLNIMPSAGDTFSYFHPLNMCRAYILSPPFSPLAPSFCQQGRLAAHCVMLSQGICFHCCGRHLPAADRASAQCKTLPSSPFPAQRPQQDGRAAFLLRQCLRVSDSSMPDSRATGFSPWERILHVGHLPPSSASPDILLCPLHLLLLSLVFRRVGRAEQKQGEKDALVMSTPASLGWKGGNSDSSAGAGANRKGKSNREAK